MGNQRNPYRPGAAVRPSFLAGRDELLAEFLTVLRDAPEIPGNIRITGLRGVGKSVLLARCEELAGEGQWATARLELDPRHNSDTGIATLVAAISQRAIEGLSLRARVSSWARDAAASVHWELSIEQVSLTLDPTAGKPSRDIVESLHRVTAEALDQGRRGFVLMLDEAQVPVDDRRPCTGSIGNRSGSPVGCVAPAWRGCSMWMDGDVSPPSQRRVTPIE